MESRKNYLKEKDYVDGILHLSAIPQNLMKFLRMMLFSVRIGDSPGFLIYMGPPVNLCKC